MSNEVTAANTPAPGPSSPASPGSAEQRIADLERALGMARASTPTADEGALGRAVHWLLGASWRTSLASYATFLGTAGVIVCTAAPDLLPHDLARWAPVIPLVAASLGLRVAKDVQTSGVARPVAPK